MSPRHLVRTTTALTAALAVVAAAAYLADPGSPLPPDALMRVASWAGVVGFIPLVSRRCHPALPGRPR